MQKGSSRNEAPTINTRFAHFPYLRVSICENVREEEKNYHTTFNPFLSGMEEVHWSLRVTGKLPSISKVGTGMMEVEGENGGGEEEWCGVYVNVGGHEGFNIRKGYKGNLAIWLIHMHHTHHKTST